LAFGKVFTYQAGTNTPKATFVSEDGVTENTNPVILNGAGYADIYLVGSYKIVVKDADDVDVWTADPVSDPSGLQKEWVNERAATQVSPTSFTLVGNYTDVYQAGKAVKMDDTTIIYGHIDSVQYLSGNTVVEVTADSSLTSDLSRVFVSLLSASGIPKSVETNINRRVFNATSVDDIQNLVGINGAQVSLSGTRFGTFRFNNSDLSTKVSEDLLQGIYIAPSSETSGSSGAWVRQYGQAVTLQPTVRSEWFGAQWDGVTDDTDAIQQALLALNRDGKLECPAGVAMATQLIVDTGIQIRGAGSGVSYIKQVSGQTVPLITDRASGQNILIYDISFDGNGNTLADGIVNLGFNGTQFGTVAMMKNCYIRNSMGTGLKVNGNVAQFDTIEVVNCVIGMDLRGVSNLCTNIITANCSSIGMNIQGARNVVRGFYAEGQSSVACMNLAADSLGSNISAVTITGIGSNIHGAGIKLNANCFLTEISGVSASVTSISNLTNGLIYDLTTGTRKIYGQSYGGVSFFIPRYNSGARTQLFYIDSSPPTTGQHLSGDWFIGAAASPGFPVTWICISSGSPGTWEPSGVVNGAIAKTSDETLTSADNGKRFSNSGSAGTVTLTLPAAFAGARYYFTRRDTSNALRVKPGGSFLAGGGFGKYAQLDSDGASIQIEYLTSNTYVITSQSGSVSFES
jgi:hypothetical protein